MKILHVASSYPPMSGSSVAPFMEEMLAALAERGHQVRILVPHRSDLSVGMRRGIDIRRFGRLPPPLQHWGYARGLDVAGNIRAITKLTAPYVIATMLVGIAGQVARWKPDVVHLHWMLPQGIGALLVPANTPTVVSLHGADARLATTSARYARMAGRVLRRATHVIAASGEILQIAAQIEPSVSRKSSVIPHGADTSLFQPGDRTEAKRHLGLDPHQPAILGVGRLVEKKGFDYLIRSMGRLPDSHHLFLVGDGPLRDHLQRHAAIAAPGRVTFLGALDRPFLPLWYQAADVVAIPSIRASGDIDSGPVVLMEALACGRAVVSTRVGMAPDVIHSGENGYLVEEADEKSLSLAILAAIDSRSALEEGAISSFRALGDWHRVAADLEGVYKSIRRAV